ncbi:hypothetical protein KP509_02G056800 [Ceratopteris richardii]|nr:hypothetical protein KP509_02G056800 [Ceratopteris richardii]
MAGGGRKKLKEGALNGGIELQPAQKIYKVISLRGSNIIEVEDENNIATLCLLPAKFNKVLWVRRGSFVLVEGGDHEKVSEFGSKVTGIICQVLFDKQIRGMKRSQQWPQAFEDSKTTTDTAEEIMDGKDNIEMCLNSGSCSEEDDDDLPPLEANRNRRPVDFNHESSSSDED